MNGLRLNMPLSVNGTAPLEPPETAGGWKPVNLAEALETALESPPSILRRSDGKHLLYADKLHWISAEPESGKTWLALAAVAEVVNDGRTAVIIDNEDSPSTAARRLKALGLTPDQMQALVHYVRPEAALWDAHGYTDAGAVWLDSLAEIEDVALVVVDGVTASMSSHSLDGNDGRDVSEWTNNLLKPIRQRTGAAVVVIDHVTKSRESRGGWAIGSQNKKAVTDVAMSMKVRPGEAFGRAMGDSPTIGTVSLEVEKDREGYLRGGFGATAMQVTSHPDGRVDIVFRPSDESRPALDDKREAEILDVLIRGPFNKGELEKQVGGRMSTTRVELERLEAEGRVTVDRSGRGHIYSLAPSEAEGMEN